MRRRDRRRRHERRQRRGGVPPQRAQGRVDREEHRWRQLDREAARVSSRPTASSSCTSSCAATASTRHSDIGRCRCRGIDRMVEQHQEVRHRMRAVEAGLAVPRPRKERQGGCRRGARVPGERRLHRPEASTTIEGLENHSRARENYSGGIRYTGTYGINPLLCVQGFKDVLIDHGMQVYESTADGTARRPHRPHARRQRHRRSDHRRRRQARAIIARSPTRSSTPRPSSASPSH